MKLNVGCSLSKYQGWINIDIDSNTKPDVIHDATKTFPYATGSVDFIYSEHFIEHLAVEGGVAFFREAFRILKPGGAMRIATPDLDALMRNHLPENKTWREDTHIDLVGLQFIKTRAESMNIAMRWWGHQFVYNYEELERRLREAGFLKIKSSPFKISDFPELCGMETRAESDLIVEVIK